MRSPLPVVVFLVALGLWTWRLLVPNPLPPAVGDEFSPDLLFILSKATHVSAYAVLTLLAAWLPVRPAWFWAAAGFLALHAIATEIGQTFVPGRVGSVGDVLLDWLGIGLGLTVVTLRRWLGGGPPTPRKR